jgi:hypothetical protein
MKRRCVLLSFTLLFVVSGLLLVPQIHWPIYGWVRGEAFYQGRLSARDKPVRECGAFPDGHGFMTILLLGPVIANAGRSDRANLLNEDWPGLSP